VYSKQILQEVSYSYPVKSSLPHLAPGLSVTEPGSWWLRHFVCRK